MSVFKNHTNSNHYNLGLLTGEIFFFNKLIKSRTESTFCRLSVNDVFHNYCKNIFFKSYLNSSTPMCPARHSCEELVGRCV